MQDHNIFGCKIYSESIFLGLNLIYKYSKDPPGDKICTFRLHIQLKSKLEDRNSEF